MNNHKSSHLVFSLSLLLIFVIGSFFVLIFETKGYSKIQGTIVEQEGLYTPISYLNTKCRKNPNISIKTIDKTKCIVLEQTAMKTYIYYQNGYLKELYASDGYEVDLFQGNKLFALDNFKISLEGDLLEIRIQKDKVDKKVYVHLDKEVVL